MGKIYDCFVLPFVDVLPVSEDGKILLGLRKTEPKTWWTVGKGIIPGETLAETAKKVLQEELGINANPSRFKLICINSSVYEIREQPPKENGRATLIMVFSILIKQKEIRNLISQSGKYHALKWFPCPKINKDFDPVIRKTVKALI